jgi:transposase InsO family protein
MPWKEATKVSERGELIQKWKSGHYGVSELAEGFGISRPTVYEWIARYEKEGEAGLKDRPSTPGRCPHQTTPEIAQQIISTKRKYPNWGPAKLIDLLRIEQPQIAWPAASTAGTILDREGLVRHRQKRRKSVFANARRLEAAESGQMMTVDHKGQFRMGNGKYCFPLTITDPVSRFIYAVDAKQSTSSREARQTFEAVFEEHGVPKLIGSDNGTPFSCSQALAGLSSMAVWWIKLGITPVRIHPGCPWENGIHERMHKTLKAETTRPPRANAREQQKRFDAFRVEFNTVRPHEGINGQRPAELLKHCTTPYQRRIGAVEYPGHYETRVVRPNGEIRWKGHLLFVSQTLSRERVGLFEIADGVWSLCFSTVELGRYDERTRTIE